MEPKSTRWTTAFLSWCCPVPPSFACLVSYRRDPLTLPAPPHTAKAAQAYPAWGRGWPYARAAAHSHCAWVIEVSVCFLSLFRTPHMVPQKVRPHPNFRYL